MVNILVTGANGFIGRALTREMENKAISFRAITRADGDVSVKETWEKFQSSNIVIHLAGLNFVPNSWESPDLFIDVNVMSTINALEYCRKHNAFMVFISAYVYGKPASLPITESDEPKPNNPYAFSKLMAENACHFYSKYYGVRLNILRLFNVYGPGQRNEFLMPTILDQALSSACVNVNDLAPKRDYIHIDDVIDAILLSTENQYQFEIFNIGSGVSFSIEEIIKKVQKVLGVKLKISSKNIERKNELLDVVADITKAKNLLNWEPKVSFDEGIRSMILAMQNNEAC